MTRRPLRWVECAAVLVLVQALGLWVAGTAPALVVSLARTVALAIPIVTLAIWRWLPGRLAPAVVAGLVGQALVGAWLASSGIWSLGQLLVLAMPAGVLAMGAAIRLGRVAPSKPFAVCLSIALTTLVLDGAGRWWFRPNPIVESAGLCESDAELGWRLRPNNGWKVFYPENPRSYFDLEPNDGLLDARLWLRNHDSGVPARFTSTSERDGSIQVTCDEDLGPSPWKFQLFQQFWPVTQGDELALEFEARAQPPRKIEIVLPISSAPAQNNGLQQSVEVGPSWEHHELRVRLPVSDQDARLIIACGGPAGEFALRGVRATINGAAPRQDPARRFSVFHRTNSQGYRWPRDYALESAGATRIAVLGDSYTFGWGVRVEDTLGVSLERALADSSRRDSPVEVLNFAVPGYNSQQQRLCFEQVVRAYRPQIVVVVMVFNDNEPLPDPSAEPATRSQAWSKVLNGWLRQAGVRSAFDDYQVCCDELGQLAESCRAAEAELVLVAFRNDDFPRWMSLVETVSAWAAQRQIRFLDLGPGIQSLLQSNWDAGFAYDAFHPNEHVHRHAGKALAKYLVEQQLLD